MSRASLLALDLHERRCIGVENGYCERGGHHAKTFLPLAKEALAGIVLAVVVAIAWPGLAVTVLVWMVCLAVVLTVAAHTEGRPHQ